MRTFGTLCAIVLGGWLTVSPTSAVSPPDPGAAGPYAFGDEERDHAEFGPWVAAVNLGPVLNSALNESAPALSPDGLSLYFQSGRDSANADFDLFVAHRAAIDLPWEPAVSLGPAVNSSAQDTSPSLSRDGTALFFASSRSGDFDIYVSRRANVSDDFGWGTPTRLPAPINGSSFDAGPWLFEQRRDRPQLYFASDRANGLGQAGLDIYVSELEKDGAWTPPVPVDEVNSVFQDNRPSIRADGLEMILTSTRNGDTDLFASHRQHLWERWSVPERIEAPVNSGATDTQAALSPNGRTLYFGSNRTGTVGGVDLYASTRVLISARRE